jgi:hypothetical protein
MDSKNVTDAEMIAVLDGTIDEAVKTFLDRKYRKAHPKGNFDSVSRWTPNYDERCECCKNIRRPTRSYPFSLLVHCRTAEHVANLFGVDVALVKKLAKHQELVLK